MSLVDLTFCLL